MAASANDTLDGGGGNDVLIGGAGKDQMNGGGAFHDRASYAYLAAGITIDLTNTANSTGDAKGDSYTAVEDLDGTQGDDIVILSDLSAAEPFSASRGTTS